MFHCLPGCGADLAPRVTEESTKMQKRKIRINFKYRRGIQAMQTWDVCTATNRQAFCLPDSGAMIEHNGRERLTPEGWVPKVIYLIN